MKNILVLIFHPRLEASRVNKFLLEIMKSEPHLKVKDMYELYPDFNIDIRKEQEDLLKADLIIMQHPFFWYAAPPLVKQWIDLVLEFGWAYGKGGDQLKGKKILHIISSRGGFEAYSREGKNLYTYNELLRPFELTYKLCRMEKLPPYIIPLANKIQMSELENHGHQIRKILEKFSSSELPFLLPENIAYLNELN